MKLSKLVIFLTVLSAVGLRPGSGLALDLKDGFFDIPWGAYIGVLEGFELLERDLQVSYYVKPDRTYRIEAVEVKNVVYGFYADRFFAVYVPVVSIDVFGHLKKYIYNKYGDPRIVMEAKPQQTVYTWKHGQVRIKMKHREEEGPMKLAFYYMPLAGKANRAQAEAYEAPPKAPFPLNERKQREAVEHFNLLNF